MMAQAGATFTRPRTPRTVKRAPGPATTRAPWAPRHARPGRRGRHLQLPRDVGRRRGAPWPPAPRPKRPTAAPTATSPRPAVPRRRQHLKPRPAQYNPRRNARARVGAGAPPERAQPRWRTHMHTDSSRFRFAPLSACNCVLASSKARRPSPLAAPGGRAAMIGGPCRAPSPQLVVGREIRRGGAAMINVGPRPAYKPRALGARRASSTAASTAPPRPSPRGRAAAHSFFSSTCSINRWWAQTRRRARARRHRAHARRRRRAGACGDVKRPASAVAPRRRAAAMRSCSASSPSGPLTLVESRATSAAVRPCQFQ